MGGVADRARILPYLDSEIDQRGDNANCAYDLGNCTNGFEIHTSAHTDHF